MHYPKNMQGYAAQRTAEDIEGQNNDNLEGLSAKVRMLKDVSERRWCSGSKALELTLSVPQITINIGNEVRDSTKLLSGMVRRVLEARWSGPIELTFACHLFARRTTTFQQQVASSVAP